MDQQEIFTVVVVEDEELILNNTVKKIQESGLGFLVSAAFQNGSDAIAFIEKEPPDVMITDIRMPVMDGLELLKIVATRFPYIKTIVISGHDEFAYAQQAIKYNVMDYLLKPLKMDELKAALTRLRIMLENEKSTIRHSMPVKPSSSEDVAKTIELYIRENYKSDINFDRIAQEYNFSSAYLSKVFTKYFRETPSRYLILLRINEAKHLLLSEKNLSVKEVGELVGYPDQFYFSRIFKNISGISPATFKALMANK